MNDKFLEDLKEEYHELAHHTCIQHLIARKVAELSLEYLTSNPRATASELALVVVRTLAESNE